MVVDGSEKKKYNGKNKRKIIDVNNDDNKVEEKIKTDSDNKRFNCLCLIIFYMLFISLFLLFPKINLYGDERVILSYRDSYVEDGFESKFLNYDFKSNVKINNNVNDNVVGNYEIDYYYDFLGVRVKRKRYVSVRDTIKPVINVDNSVITICPSQDIPDINYSAFDEYDGDISLRVKKEIVDDRILLSVLDSSLNFTEVVVDVLREDKENPVIKLKGSSVMFVNYGQEYKEPGYDVSDNCDTDLNVKVNGSVGRNVGTYYINYEVSDKNGNKSNVIRKVIVGNKIKDNGIVHNGSIYLTFDDGPNDGTTNKILDILKVEGVKATFFVTCRGSDGLIKRIFDEGHTVALHTAFHDYSYIYSSVDNYFSDLNMVSKRVERITGVKSKIIRFPGGSSNTISRNYKVGIMTELSNLVLYEGYRYYDWNVDSMDASSARNSNDVYYNVTSRLSINRDNVVLMHDTKSITMGALVDIIRFGKDSGYTFRKIDMNTYMVRHGINN